MVWWMIMRDRVNDEHRSNGSKKLTDLEEILRAWRRNRNVEEEERDVGNYAYGRWVRL